MSKVEDIAKMLYYRKRQDLQAYPHNKFDYVVYLSYEVFREALSESHMTARFANLPSEAFEFMDNHTILGYKVFAVAPVQGLRHDYLPIAIYSTGDL